MAAILAEFAKEKNPEFMHPVTIMGTNLLILLNKIKIT